MSSTPLLAEPRRDDFLRVSLPLGIYISRRFVSAMPEMQGEDITAITKASVERAWFRTETVNARFLMEQLYVFSFDFSLIA